MPKTSDRLLRLRRALWHLRKGGVSELTRHLRRERIEASAPGSLTPSPLDVPAAVPSHRQPRFADVRAAVIVDDFSAAAWGHEFTTIPVTPAGWRSELGADDDTADSSVDILLVESAWRGNGGAWQYQLTGSRAPSTALRELVSWCRERGIPTVFWNKEDPPHFRDFLDTALLFDAVFTSDSRLVPAYREAFQRSGASWSPRIHTLPFAAQDALHNPIRPAKGFHSRDVAFAGMYFAHKFPERRLQMDLLLGAAQRVSHRMETGLEIYSRFLGEDSSYQFPPPFDGHVVGSLPYERMLSAYKAHKVFLNVNSVTDSPSMCARRVFEITASGTPVISTPSLALEEFFPESEVPLARTPQQAEGLIRAYVRSPELNDRTVHLAQRRIWSHHTYSHRAVTVLESAGLTEDTAGCLFADRLSLPPVSALVSTHRPGRLNDALETLAGFRDVSLQPCILTHGFETDPQELHARARDLGLENLVLLNAPRSAALGDCLNLLVKAADGAVLAKVDDDDLYGPHYLADLLRAQRFSGADIVGKQAHYLHLASRDATLLRFSDREHRWTDLVMGPTITGSAELFASVPFQSRAIGEDTAFLQDAAAAGARIYSADRFNFCQIRQPRAEGHTWAVEDDQILGTGELFAYGLPTSHIIN